MDNEKMDTFIFDTKEPFCLFVASSQPHSPKYLLFDLKKDPKELKNLARDKKYQSVMEDMIVPLNKWIKEVGDKGMEIEFEAIKIFPRKKIEIQK